MKHQISFLLNGNLTEMQVDSHMTLLELLRDHLGLKGTKRGCEMGDCGSCTVIMNGRAVNACMVLVPLVNGKKVVTIEGLAVEDTLHSLQGAFLEKGAIQCGYCTAGMIMAAKALLDEHRNPTEEEIRKSIVGNLCRCTGYQKIVEAILSVGND